MLIQTLCTPRQRMTRPVPAQTLVDFDDIGQQMFNVQSDGRTLAVTEQSFRTAIHVDDGTVRVRRQKGILGMIAQTDQGEDMGPVGMIGRQQGPRTRIDRLIVNGNRGFAQGKHHTGATGYESAVTITSAERVPATF